MERLNPKRAGELPLCLHQEQFLLSREWMRHRSNVPPSLASTALSLRGILKRDAVERTLNELVRRHEAFRLRIYPAPTMLESERQARLIAFGKGIFRPGFFRQSVTDNTSAPLKTIDLAGMNPDARAEALQSALMKEARQVFDYQRPPLMRATLFRLEPGYHLVVISVDHAVTDAWSMRILRSEFARLYSYFSAGGTYPLPELRLHYPDYAIWQHQAISNGFFANAADFWARRWLAVAHARIAARELPFAAPEPQTDETPFGSERAELDPALSREIRNFARRLRITLNVFFFAAYSIVLHSYTRKSRVALWGHFSNRRRPEFQDTVGYFVHSHLIGVDFEGDPSGRELLEQIRQTTLEAFEHQEMPLPYLWNRLNCWPRFADVRVLLDYHNAWEDDFRANDGLVIRRADLPDLGIRRFSNLGVYVTEKPDNTSLSVQYSRERFSPAAVRDLIRDLHVVMAGLLKDPTRKVSAILGDPRYAGFAGEPVRDMGEFIGAFGEIVNAPASVEEAKGAVRQYC
jgi:Condensation domain